MKSTGVIRRIDELGRIVIPKEIRKSLRIHEGDSIEIYTDNNENIVLKKYSNIDSRNDIAKILIKEINKYLKHDVLITDQDKIIAVEGSMKKDYLDKELNSKFTSEFINKKNDFEDKKNIQIIDNKNLEGYFIIKPLNIDGINSGFIIIYSKDTKFTIDNDNFIQFIASFFTKYLEE